MRLSKKQPPVKRRPNAAEIMAPSFLSSPTHLLAIVRKYTRGSTGRNAALNLAAQGVQLLATIICIPFLLRSMGAERVGILTLVWSIVGYFSLLDLGIGRAVTQSISGILATGDKEALSTEFWSAVAIQMFMGIIGAVIVCATSTLITGKLLNIPVALRSEATTSILLCGSILPIVLTSSSLVGLLQAARRFDITNAVTAPSAVATLLVPVLIASHHPRLPLVMLGIVAVRLLSCVALAVCACRLYPEIISRARIVRKNVLSLLKYGSWVTVSSIISPLLTYADRFLIGSLLTMNLVTCYTIPYEAGTRLTIIATSIVTALFPVVSTAGVQKNHNEIARLLSRALIALHGPVSILAAAIFMLSGYIMLLWVGPEVGGPSGIVLSIIIIGAYITSIAAVPYTVIQAIGRPDITAKLHLMELPVHVTIVWFAVRKWGIYGAAGAYTFRVLLDFCLLCGALTRLTDARIGRIVLHQYIIAVALFLLQVAALWATGRLFGQGLATFVVALTGVAALALLFSRKCLRAAY